MLTQFVIDEQSDDKQTIRELVTKVNELVTTVSAREVNIQPRRTPDKAAHLHFMETLVGRMRSGPLQQLLQLDPNKLTKDIDDTLTAFQEALQVYKQSITS